jgi:hypothetical protein
MDDTKGDVEMIRELLLTLFCLWVASKLRRRHGAGDGQATAWHRAKKSLRWGTAIVTVSLLAHLGVVRIVHGMGLPSIPSLVLCVGLTALVLLGAEVEFSGNVVVDSLLLSLALVARASIYGSCRASSRPCW